MKFRITPHFSRPGIDVAEAFADDGRFVAAIMPGNNDEEIRVVSKYYDRRRSMDDIGALPPMVRIFLNKANEPSENWKDDCLREHKRILTGEKAHWCPAWDLLPIDETCKEFETCVCFGAWDSAKREDRDIDR